MTRTISSKLALIGLSLMLTACAQHGPRQANCFNFRDAPARAASSATTVSTMGAAVTRRDTACDFVMLGAGG
jgi:predicted small lipoprotein YifL